MRANSTTPTKILPLTTLSRQHASKKFAQQLTLQMAKLYILSVL